MCSNRRFGRVVLQADERRREWARNVEDEGGCGVASLFSPSQAPTTKWMLSDREDGVRARFQLRKNMHFKSHQEAAYANRTTRRARQPPADSNPPPIHRRDWPPQCWAKIFQHCQVLLALDSSLQKRSRDIDNKMKSHNYSRRLIGGVVG